MPLPVGKIDWQCKRLCQRANRVTIGVLLAMDRVRRRCNPRLVEGNRNNFMAAKIADVADVDGEIVPRLPLNVEGLIECVGKLVARL